MIYTDLDNTLIDSIKRCNMDIAAAKKFDISEENFWGAVHKTMEQDGLGKFSNDRLFGTCKEMFNLPNNTLVQEWDRISKIKCFFTDSLFFLFSFEKKDLALLTTGSKKLQQRKIDVHNIAQYFHEIHIVGSPKYQFITPEAGSIFIDDSPREIDAMKTMFPFVYCILVRELAPWETQKKSKLADMYCPDLCAVTAHIKTLR